MLAMLGGIHSAHAHGIAGNRFFPGTLSFDDPAVADEAILPNFASFKSPIDGGNVVDNRFDWSFFRLLTPTLGVDVDSAWVHRNWGNALRSGFDVTSLGLKGLVYRNDLHEMLVSARLGWGIGHSGAQGISANAPDLLQPGIFFGKGFGDLPDGLAWLRPFGITGAITLDHPMTGNSINFGIDPQTGQLGPMLTRNVDILHWGVRARIQHALSDQPLHAWKTSQGRTAKPACATRRVFIRFATRREDHSDDEPRLIVRRGKLAIGGRSYCAAQQRSRTFYRGQGATTFISR